MPMFIITGSRIRHAISWPRSSSSAAEHLEVVERHDVRVVGHHRRDAGRHRRGRRSLAAAHQVGARHHREHHGVVVPVVRALDLHDVLASGRGARDPDRAHRRLGARVAEAHRLGLEALAQLLGEADGRLGGRGEVRAGARGALDRLGDLRVRVAHDHEPKPLWKSTYSLPSTSQTRLPFPSRRYTG